MTSASAATRLVTAAAREVLKPMAIVQKGRSRTWYSDHGWWLLHICFDTSRWSQGTYLMVGPMWLWHERAHWAFDHGGRVHWRGDGTCFSATRAVGAGAMGYLEFRDEEQFACDVRLVVDIAARQAGELRRQFSDVAGVVRALAAAGPGLPGTEF